MGCDGGTIPTRDELVKTKKKPEQKDKDSERLYRWQHCHLSQEPLQRPVVSCGLGRLYNKEAILQDLIDKTNKVKHIKGLKDVCELELTTNPAYDGSKSSVGDNYNDKRISPWICPITGLEMNGRFKFVFDWASGRVMSERALKMVQQDGDGSVLEENIVVLNPDTDDEKDLLLVKMDGRKAREKAAKKAKKESKRKAAEQEDSSSGFKQPAVSGPSSTSNANGVSAAKKIREEDQNSKNGKSSQSTQKKGSSVQNDPTKSEIYKSLFSSHKSAQNRPKGNWVTFDPRYN